MSDGEEQSTLTIRHIERADGWNEFVRAAYFSIVTMTTLGFGDLHANGQATGGDISGQPCGSGTARSSGLCVARRADYSAGSHVHLRIRPRASSGWIDVQSVQGQNTETC